MKLNEILKKLKPSQWYHWVGYGSFGAVIASGIAVGVVVGVKDGGDSTSKPNLENKNNSTKKPIKQGKQADLPNESSKSINVGTLKTELIKKGPLDLEGAVEVLKNVGVPVDKTKGTSYDKKKGMHKVIGNKYGDINRFVEAWNKLSADNKNALDRHSFAYLFGKVPESNFHIGHQVEYILLDPVNKKSTTKGSTESTKEGTGVAADAFTKWAKALKNNDFSNLINNTKLPSQITNADVLNVMKDLDSFKALENENQAKLTSANITLYNKEDQSGKISIKITQDGKELTKIKALLGFKFIGISEGDIKLADDYKKALNDSINALKTKNSEQAKNISYYEFKKGDSTITYPIVAEDDTKLDKTAKTILKMFGFNSKKIYLNISNADKNNPFSGKTYTKNDMLKIGYKSSKDQKFYLFSNNKTSYNSVEDAVEYFMNNSKKNGGTIEDFVKSNLNSIKKELGYFGVSIATPNLDKIISDETYGVANAITEALSPSQKTAIDALINKYLPNGNSLSAKFLAKVYEKDSSSGKYLNGSDELIKGGGKYPASFKIENQFYAIWGLLNAKKANIKNKDGNLKNFKSFGSNIIGHVDAIAVVNTNKDARSKKMTFVFLKIGNSWIFATDYINYIEGKKPEKIVKLTLVASDKGVTEDAMNKDFSDLVTYTKASLL